MDQLPFYLPARLLVGNAAALQSGGVVHRQAGFALEHRTRRPVAQCLVQALLVVESQPAANALARLCNRAIGFDEHVLVFEATPQPLDEDVVQEPPFPVHADSDAAAFQFLQEARAGELDALVGVEDVRLTVPGDRFLKRLNTKSAPS